MRKIFVCLFFMLGAAPCAFAQTPAGGYSSPAAGGVGGGACVGKNCFLLQNYSGYFGDAQEILTATWTGASTSISTSTANAFSPSDTGKLCWGSPQSMQGGPSTAGTFTYISATSGTCAPSGSLIGGPTGNGMFTWGRDDTTAYIAATAALFTQPKCGSLIIPAARTMIKQGVSYTGSVASDCSVNIVGAGYASVIELEPGFSPSTTTNNVGCQSLGCFWNTSASTAYLYFTIGGEYQSMTGVSSAPASALFTIGPGSYAIGVNLFNWGTAFSNTPQGTNISGTGPFGLGYATTNWGDGNIWCSATPCIGENDGGTATLKTQGGATALDYAGTYGGVYTSGSGAETHLYGTQSSGNNGGFGSMSCDFKGGEKIFMQGAKPGGFGSVGSGGIGFQFNNNSGGSQCILDMEGSTFNGGSSGSAINSQVAGLGQIVDHGGNLFVGPMTFSGTYTNLTSLHVKGACTGVATAASTLGLYGTGPNVTATTCTSATIGTGIVMNKNYTIYELLATATAAGTNASSGLVTVLKNGVAQTMVCTIGTGTACQDGAVAHQISGSPGDRISLQFTSQAADTLAGVKATLVIE